MTSPNRRLRRHHRRPPVLLFVHVVMVATAIVPFTPRESGIRTVEAGTESTVNSPGPGAVMVGVVYHPNHNVEYPVRGGLPDRDKLRAAIELDLKLLRKYVTHIRTLAATYYGIDIVPMAQEVGLKVFLGFSLAVHRSVVRRQIRAVQRAVVNHPTTIAAIIIGDSYSTKNFEKLLAQLQELQIALGPYATKVKFGFIDHILTHSTALVDAFDVFGWTFGSLDVDSIGLLLKNASHEIYGPHKLAFVEASAETAMDRDSSHDFYEDLMRLRPSSEGAVTVWGVAFDSLLDDDSRVGEFHQNAGFFTADRWRKRPGFPRPLDPADDPASLYPRSYDPNCVGGMYFSFLRSRGNVDGTTGESTIDTGKKAELCMASGFNFRNPTKFNERTIEAACVNPWCHEVVDELESALASPKCPFDDGMPKKTIEELIIEPFRKYCHKSSLSDQSIELRYNQASCLSVDINGKRPMDMVVLFNKSANQEMCQSITGYRYDYGDRMTQALLQKMCFEPSCELIMFQLANPQFRPCSEMGLMMRDELERTVLQPYYDGCYESSLLADFYFDTAYRKRKKNVRMPPPVNDTVEPLTEKVNTLKPPNVETSAEDGIAAESDSSRATSRDSDPEPETGKYSYPASQRATTVRSSPVYYCLVVGGTAALLLLLIIHLIARRRRRKLSAMDMSGYATVTDDHDQSLSSSRGAVWGTNDVKPVWADRVLAALFIHPTTIRDVRLIGSGGQALVYLVTHRLEENSTASTATATQTSKSQQTRRRLLASKRLGTHHATNDPEALSTFITEIKLVATLQHPRIVSLVGATWTSGFDVQALFEYMPGGDLCNYLSTMKATDQQRGWTATKLQLAIDVIDALVYVHARTPVVVHRDVKSRNVLLTADSQHTSTTQTKSSIRAKLTDFGVARSQSARETMTTGVGTSRWLAPEVIIGGGAYDESCDVYSFGVLLSELDTHELPFMDQRTPTGDVLPAIALMELVASGEIAPSFDVTCPPSLLALARACLAFDPKQRPNAAEVARGLRQMKA